MHRWATAAISINLRDDFFRGEDWRDREHVQREARRWCLETRFSTPPNHAQASSRLSITSAIFCENVMCSYDGVM